jgi:hypothetical protein
MNPCSIGRFLFGGGNSLFTPTLARFSSDAPSFEVCTDSKPAAGGSITINQPTAGAVQVAFSSIPYHSTTTFNTFALVDDTNNSVATIDGLFGLGTGAGPMLIGASGGNAVGATTPAAAPFSPAPWAGVTANPTDMIHQIGSQGTVAPGVNRIDFVPNAFSNYDWLIS